MKQTLLLLACVLSVSAQATIITRNINYSLTGGVYQVDVNNNGTKDLFFRLKYDGSTQTINCRFGVIDLNGSVDNGTRPEGEPVGLNAFWMDSMTIFSAPGGFIDGSSWCLGGDTCYFGFGFAEGSNYYLGWVQVKTVSANELRIIRLSYNDVPDGDINFGELGGSTGITDYAADVRATFSIKGNQLSVGAQPEILSGARVILYDMAGRACAAKELSATNNEVVLDALSEGVYVAWLQLANGRVVARKVVVE
jgi:hypothetical protein